MGYGLHLTTYELETSSVSIRHSVYYTIVQFFISMMWPFSTINDSKTTTSFLHYGQDYVFTMLLFDFTVQMFLNEFSVRNLNILLHIDTHMIKKNIELYFICMHHVCIVIECKNKSRIYKLSYSIIGHYTILNLHCIQCQKQIGEAVLALSYSHVYV